MQVAYSGIKLRKRLTENEDAEHYLLRCPNFLNERVTLFHSTRDFHPLNVTILLFGDNSLTDIDNTRIFTAVQTLILSKIPSALSINAALLEPVRHNRIILVYYC